MDWILEAESATMAALSAIIAPDGSGRAALVKTIIIASRFWFHMKYYYKEEVCRRVEEWGVDGLWFQLAKSYLHILESAGASSMFPSCTTLYIHFDTHNFEALCRAIASSSPNLTHLYLAGDSSVASLDLQLVGEALLQRATSSLQSLSIDLTLCSETSIIPLLTSNTCFLKSLSITCSLAFSGDTSLFSKIIQNICIALTENTIALRSLSLIKRVKEPITRNTWQKLGTMLVHNTSLTSFTLYSTFLPAEAVRYLFTSLEKNHHLTSLSLAHCSSPEGTDWPNDSVLDSLQVNTTLHEVDLTGTPLENDNAIRAQLSRIKNNARVKVLLKARRSELVRPTTVRLFFCGLQYSGKTTLSRSLANWNQETSWFSRVRSTTRLKRTRGIEVTILEKEVGGQHQRILLWDMAGQVEFHSFHDSMFPDLSSRATPSMFLFIWNPFEIEAKGKIRKDAQGLRTRKGVHKFRDEFKYWLRFIASKTLKSEIFKPKVLVAVTRADLIGFEEDMKLWLKSEFTALQEEFKEVIQFDEEGIIFYLNAKDYLQAGQLGSHVFDCAQAILKQVPDVYQACADARELFSNMVYGNKVPPLITKAKFHELCHEELDMDSQEMREAVALSLNDSGELIYFESLELVVLDTQWFCHEIMGDLLNDIMTKKSLDGSNTRDGFFPLPALEALLERILNSRAVGTSKLMKIRRASRTLKSMKIAGCDLVKLLVGLRLACVDDTAPDNSRIFISVSLSSKGKRTIFPSNCLISDAGASVHTYLGRRLTCKDSKRTLLTLGLFPLLQVTFHKILHDREVPIPIRLEEDVMAFAFGGVKVFIEFFRVEGEDHFIDILIYSSKSRDKTIKWLQKSVILDVEKVCAEPRGNQGVVLAHAIIQRACIENFLVDARSRPAVSVKELQDVLRDHMEREGEDGIKNALHTWQTPPFPASSVVDLLGEVETAKVVQTYQCGLSDAKREISNLFVDKAKTSQPQKPEFSMSQPSEERDQALYNKMCEVQENVTRELQNMGYAVQELCNAVKDQRNAVLPKLCELFTFVKDGEAGKLPRMFVVTTDNGILRQVVSAMVPGLRNVRLELLCECRSEPCHRVEEQHGLSLATLDDGLLRHGLPYINAVLKLAYVIARVGAHVAVGFGDSIPDFTRVLANVVDANVVDANVVPDFNTDLTDDWNSSSRVDFQDGQQWLFDVLSNQNCIKGDQIHAKFGLRRVRLHDSRAAWVCDKHYTEGRPWPA